LDENGKPIDDVQISDENNNETTDNKSKRRRKENINSELEETNQTLNPFDVVFAPILPNVLVFSAPFPKFPFHVFL
jgi:hypothetical protein